MLSLCLIFAGCTITPLSSENINSTNCLVSFSKNCKKVETQFGNYGDFENSGIFHLFSKLSDIYFSLNLSADYQDYLCEKNGVKKLSSYELRLYDHDCVFSRSSFFAKVNTCIENYDCFANLYFSRDKNGFRLLLGLDQKTYFSIEYLISGDCQKMLFCDVDQKEYTLIEINNNSDFFNIKRIDFDVKNQISLFEQDEF